MATQIAFENLDGKLFVAFLVADPCISNIKARDLRAMEITILELGFYVPAANIEFHIPGIYPSIFSFMEIPTVG